MNEIVVFINGNDIYILKVSMEKQQSKKTVGILTACDQRQEWMLRGWYHHLRLQHPDIPIAFGDFGMSEAAKDWCRSKGTLIPTSDIPVYTLPANYEYGWQYGGKKWVGTLLYEHPDRFLVFRKPFLMQKSPFDRTIWLDMDCQVLKSLSCLFFKNLSPNLLAIGLAWPKQTFAMHSLNDAQQMPVLCYNSGVVVFEKSSPLLKFWADFTMHAGHNFSCDDHILSFAIQNYGFPTVTLPFYYNRPVQAPKHSKTAVLHWMREGPKHILRLLYLNLVGS